MSAPIRRLRQPGPRRPERWLGVPGRARHLAFTLAPGLPLVEAIARPLADAGIAGGTVELSGGALSPFTYVMPALSEDPRFAATYSRTYAPPGTTRLARASASFGRRDGAPFVHCHGLWVEPGGARRGGHVMPHDTVVAEAIAARAVGVAEAAFDVLPDAETNFSVLTPVACGAVPPDGHPSALLLKLQPNESIENAIAAAARAHGIAAARIHGVGSLVGVDFADGRRVPSIATEVFVTAGELRLGPGGDTVALDLALVDVDGTVHEGRAAPGNAVCITFELTLAELRTG